MPTTSLTLTAPKLVPGRMSYPVVSNAKVPYTFVRGTSKYSGDEGWRPKEIPGFDPVSPVMVVHDILEHFPGDEGEVYNEYQAQGAMFWIRHEGGFFDDSGDATSDVVIKPAFGQLFYHIVKNKLTTAACPTSKEAQELLKNKDTDYEMQRTVSNAFEYIEERFESGFQYKSNHGSKAAQKERLTKSLTHALGWMRIGYHRCAMRYKGVSQERLARLYSQVVEKIEEVERKIDGGSTSFGDPPKDTETELTIWIDPKKYTASVSASEEFTVT